MALLRFIRWVGVSERKIETTQEAGCDVEHCNQELYSGHGLSSARLLVNSWAPQGNGEERRAPARRWAMCGALMTNRCAGFYAFTQRALRSYGAVDLSVPF